MYQTFVLLIQICTIHNYVSNICPSHTNMYHYWKECYPMMTHLRDTISLSNTITIHIHMILEGLSSSFIFSNGKQSYFH
jgi:hypothetical protein